MPTNKKMKDVLTSIEKVVDCFCVRCGSFYGEVRPTINERKYCPDCRVFLDNRARILDTLIDKIMYIEEQGYEWDLVINKKTF